MANVDSLVLNFPDTGDKTENIDFSWPVSFVRVVYAPINFAIYAGYGTSIPIREVRAGERIDLELPQPTDNLTIKWLISPAVPGAEYAKGLVIIADAPLAATGDGEQSLGLAVYDSLGQIRGWNALASGDSVTNQQSHAAMVYISNASIITRQTRNRTYDSVARRTTRDYESGIAFAAPGRSPLMTLWNPGGATLTLLSADVGITKTSAAAQVWIELMEITTQPSGGASTTPMPRLLDDTASAAEVRRVPSGGGLETGNPYSSVVYQLGITGADSAAAPAAPVPWQSLFNPVSDGYGESYIEIPAGRGLGIIVDSNAAATVRCIAKLSYWEV